MYFEGGGWCTPDPSLGLGVAASDTVLITPEGCESLSKLPRDLLVIPTEKPSL